MSESAKRNNMLDILKSPFQVIINIFKYAFMGLKYICLDLWFDIYNSASYGVDRTYQSTKQAFMTQEEKIYERTRKKVKKEKVYKYSARTLAKLEEEKKELLVDLQTAGATRSREPHVYYYKVRDNTGKIVTGTMNGLSKLDINAYLLNEGYDVYVIKTSPFIDFVYKESSFLGKKMKTKDLIFWKAQ